MDMRTKSLVVTLFSCALLAGVVRRTPQTLYCDPAYQIKALQQFLAGESISINHLTTPDPKDLTKNTTEWFSWWPPGTELILYPFLVRGVSIGAAVRVIVMVCLTLGCLGWVFWFSLFQFPKGVHIGLALLFPWMRYASNVLFGYSGEIFAFALAPWIFWCTDRLVSACGRRRETSASLIAVSALFGFGLGLVYVLKYSIVFASLPALIYLGTRNFSVEKDRKTQSVRNFFAAGLCFLIPVIALNVLNYRMSRDMNPVVTTLGMHWKWPSFLWVLAMPPLGLADGYDLCSYVFMHPVHGIFKNEWIICLLGLPGGLLLLGLLYRQRAARGPARLAILTLLFAMGSMLAVWNLSFVGNYDGRYLAIFSLGVLPVALEEGFSFYRSRSELTWKAALTAALVFYIVVPLLYGVVSVVMKVSRTPSDYRVGPSHLYNASLADRDLEGVRGELLRDYRPASDIWYFPEPVTALDLPGRALISFADFIDIQELQKVRYHCPVSKRVRLLVSPRLELNGKGPVIRQSFPQAGVWTRKEIPGSNYLLWEATLQPQ